jgi:hypothetical protein
MHQMWFYVGLRFALHPPRTIKKLLLYHHQIKKIFSSARKIEARMTLRLPDPSTQAAYGSSNIHAVINFHA